MSKPETLDSLLTLPTRQTSTDLQRIEGAAQLERKVSLMLESITKQRVLSQESLEQAMAFVGEQRELSASQMTALQTQVKEMREKFEVLAQGIPRGESSLRAAAHHVEEVTQKGIIQTQEIIEELKLEVVWTAWGRYLFSIGVGGISSLLVVAVLKIMGRL